MFSKKEFPVVNNLRFISRTNFHAQLSWAWKKFHNLGACLQTSTDVITSQCKSRYNNYATIFYNLNSCKFKSSDIVANSIFSDIVANANLFDVM